MLLEPLTGLISPTLGPLEWGLVALSMAGLIFLQITEGMKIT